MDVAKEALTATVSLFERLTTPTAVTVPPALATASAHLGRAAGASGVALPHIDVADAVLWQAILLIVLQPTIWNLIGRFEHHTRLLSRLLLHPQVGVLALTIWIFAAGRYRDMVVILAMSRQETLPALDAPVYRALGVACIVVGATLVLTSFAALGVNGTFLGDYFGFLMDEPVTRFPFSVLSDPMYDGSTLTFLGKALLARSPTGLLLTACVYAVYRVAAVVEGAFLREVYSKRAKKTN